MDQCKTCAHYNALMPHRTEPQGRCTNEHTPIHPNSNVKPNFGCILHEPATKTE
ncbi:hypothetical protein [Marinococcus halophilus]|uniref:hypothetical protein n=1 Tax=Marinococcus halophilus TaxID=1371 RepID=UPI0015C46E71|nr:hypothetical protein [Marinococcus halophilus]